MRKSYHFEDLITSVSETYKFDKEQEEVIFLNTSDIYNGKVLSHLKSKVKDLPGQAKKRIRSGDILFSEIRPINRRFAFIDFNAEGYVVSTKLMVLRCKDKIIPRYLLYYLTTDESLCYLQLLAEARSGTFPQITFNQIKELEINLPSVDEQEMIVAILFSLDDKIDLLHRQNQTLEALAETIFRQWFVVEADKGWELLTINDLIEVKDGTHDSPKQTDCGFKLITSKHLKPEGIDFSNAYYISEDDYESVNKRSKVEKNDILISMIGTLGLIHFVKENNIDYAIKNIGLFKTSQKPWLANYLYFFLRSPLGKIFLMENAVGSTQEYIPLGSLRLLEIYLPENSLIDRYNAVVDPIVKKIYKNKSQIQTLSTLRDTLLPKLMSGEVRVDYNKDEVEKVI